ncbi:helix-turn-helix domain-containing protein [Massilia sp. BJB1822]|uniref:helix-turn-helix domain-containing protein n=1 Tax=Massilia sp. BJB1822 TaxID=2744470 RepID=UPI001592CD7F|nr:XRE family transcriptional regulator [Massilia sp. BJB1822]NVD97136.1 XRE family transcriptional regulator [Massilia sp. BJB1822]
MKIDTEVRHTSKPGLGLFQDLGFSREEAERLHAALQRQINDTLRLKEQLMQELSSWIEEQELKQANAAKILMTSRSNISDIVHKRGAKFTIDALVGMLSLAGKSVRVVVE